MALSGAELARRGRGVSRQSRARRARSRRSASAEGHHRHAGDDAVDQGRRGRGARRACRPERRLVQRCLRARAVAAGKEPCHIRASLRRSRRHRRAGNDRRGDPAPMPGSDRCDLRGDRRRRARLRHRLVRQACAPGDQDHRCAAGRLRRDGAFAGGGAASQARPRRAVRRRSRGQAGQQGDVSHLSRAARRSPCWSTPTPPRRGRVRGHAGDAVFSARRRPG